MECGRLSWDRQEKDTREGVGSPGTGQVMGLSQVGRRKGYQEAVGPGGNGDLEGPVSPCR